MSKKVLYRTSVTNVGGRSGKVQSDDGALSLQVRQPTSLGGPEGNYTNPEQLFAAAYAACFGGTLEALGKGKNLSHASVTVEVAVCHQEGSGYVLSVTIFAHLPELSPEEANALVKRAHQVCPYSKAVRNNIEVLLFANQVQVAS